VIQGQTQLNSEFFHFNILEMANLAEAYQKLEQMEDAENQYQKVLKVRTLAAGVEHPDTLDTMMDLASFYRGLGRTKDSYERLNNAHEAIVQNLEYEEIKTLSDLNRLCLEYQMQGRLQEAVKLRKKMVDVGRRVLKQSHPEVLEYLEDLELRLLEGTSNDKILF